MERKTKQRLLGVLVVVSLVIILLPLFQGQNDSKPETTLVQAPPFPDQASQVATNTASNAPQPLPIQVADNGVNQQPDDVIRTSPTMMSATQTPAPITPEIENTIKPAIAEPSATATATSSVVSANKITDANTNNADAKNSTLIAEDEDEGIVAKSAGDILDPNSPKARANAKRMMSVEVNENKLSPKQSQRVQVLAKDEPFVPKIKPFVPSSSAHADNTNGLMQLKNSAWVVQMGSFKSKTNALHLVNQLRAGGYKAFIQQVANNTRVFVGPERKQTAARAIASQLENSMHMHGIVISYQPLDL